MLYNTSMIRNANYYPDMYTVLILLGVLWMRKGAKGKNEYHTMLSLSCILFTSLMSV